MIIASMLFVLLTFVSGTGATSDGPGEALRPDSGSVDGSLAPAVEASRAAAESWTPVAGLTMAMRAAADSILVAQLGQQLFDELIVFDPVNTDSAAYKMQRFGIGGRVVSYWLVVPDDPDAVAPVAISLSAYGALNRALGVPECRDDASRCVFIDHESAFEAARGAGLEEGIAPWRWSFSWAPGVGYFYTVIAILGEDGKSRWGEDVIIDAHDGTVLRRIPTKYGPAQDAEAGETPG